ncbi:MAG: leucine-rich repeat domain-containing protein [Planctomycetota bacterium]|jgi:tetratricopeptide (TPR) repeat protein
MDPLATEVNRSAVTAVAPASAGRRWLAPVRKLLWLLLLAAVVAALLAGAYAAEGWLAQRGARHRLAALSARHDGLTDQIALEREAAEKKLADGYRPKFVRPRAPDGTRIYGVWGRRTQRVLDIHLKAVLLERELAGVDAALARAEKALPPRIAEFQDAARTGLTVALSSLLVAVVAGCLLWRTRKAVAFVRPEKAHGAVYRWLQFGVRVAVIGAIVFALCYWWWLPGSGARLQLVGNSPIPQFLDVERISAAEQFGSPPTVGSPNSPPFLHRGQFPLPWDDVDFSSEDVVLIPCEAEIAGKRAITRRGLVPLSRFPLEEQNVVGAGGQTLKVRTRLGGRLVVFSPKWEPHETGCVAYAIPENARFVFLSQRAADAVDDVLVGVVLLAGIVAVVLSWPRVREPRARIPGERPVRASDDPPEDIAPVPKEPPRRRRVQFGMLTLMGMVTLAAVGLSFRQTMIEPYRVQRQGTEKVARLGGACDTLPAGPAWLRFLGGDDLFQDVVAVDLHYSRWLEEEDLAFLEDFPNLERLYLAQAVRARLEALDFQATLVSDEGMACLEDMTSLVELRVSRRIGDEGLRHVAGLHNLRFLGLRRSQVTDEGLKHLYGLANLKGVHLTGSLVTTEGVEKLRQALPGLLINFREGYHDLRGEWYQAYGAAKKGRTSLQRWKSAAQQADLVDARRSFREAIRLNPRLVDAYLGRAELYDALERPDDAARDRQTAERLCAEKPYGWNYPKQR